MLTIEEWHDHLQQIEESIRENLDTRKSVEQKLQQNKAQGKELQSQLPQRVFNEDLRTFLELIQRVQVLEVERLELDHLREARRAQLEERDQEIEALREQLRLRNEHLGAQRQLLSDEQQKKMPRRVSLLGSTLSEASPMQKRGPMQVMHAWAPAPKESEDVAGWDSRPLREREPLSDQEREAIDTVNVPALGVGLGFDWKNLEVPLASQIRGIARIQPPLGSRAPMGPGNQARHDGLEKGWRHPHHPPAARASPDLGLLGLRPNPIDAARGPGHDRQAENLKPQTGGPAVVNRSAVGCTSPVTRGSTCPPLRRQSPERRPPIARRPSGDDTEELGAAPRSRWAPPRIAGQGVAPPPRRVQPHPYEDKVRTPGVRRRGRARSEHSGFRMGMGRVGQFVMK